MKKLNTLVKIMLLLLFAGAASGQNKGAIVMAIKDAGQNQQPGLDIMNHQHHDIDVYKVLPDSLYQYEVVFYKKENDTVRRYQATFGAKCEMNNAVCRWLNDSLAAVRLYNSRSKKETSFTVSGYGIGRGLKSTTIAVDD